MTASAIRIIVTGRVQGVGFRAYAAERARELGLVGWAANREDGSVESVVRGPAGAVEAYMVALRGGPPGASVTEVGVDEVAPERAGESGFVVR